MHRLCKEDDVPALPMNRAAIGDTVQSAARESKVAQELGHHLGRQIVDVHALITLDRLHDVGGKSVQESKHQAPLAPDF